MRPKALVMVVLGLIIFVLVAHAESPVSLTEIAPVCRSLVKARQGFEGFFVYSHNPQVDAVFPIVKDKVLASASWQPLAEVETKLTELARRHRALALVVSSSDDSPGFRVVFINRGKETFAVNRGGRLEYVVSGSTGKIFSHRTEPVDWNLAPDYVDLQPGESTFVEAPAQLLEGMPAGPIRVAVTYTNIAEDPLRWSGVKESPPYRVQTSGPTSGSEASGSSRPETVVDAPAPRFTELAAKAGVEGETRVSVAILPSGAVAEATVMGERLPMGLSSAAVEAARKWRFAMSGAERRQELVFEFRLAGYCDPEPPPFERIGEHRIRVWKRMESLNQREHRIIVGRDGVLRCAMTVREAPQCGF